MAKINPNRAHAKKILEGFHGIGTYGHTDENGAADLVNFRLCPDGSLTPRDGTCPLWSFPSGQSVRGYWEGMLDGEFLMLAVAGYTVYRLHPETKSMSPCCTIATRSGRVRFALFRGVLYLFDGSTILRWSTPDKRFSSCDPYVPLYGYRWHPQQLGDVHEPINLLTPHLRIHYLNSTATTTFYLPFYPKAIDSVRSPDRELTEYTFQSGTNVVTIPNASSCETIVISITVDTSDTPRKAILRSRQGFVFSKGRNEALLLYGGDGDGKIYCTSPVSEKMLTDCHADFASALPLYVTDEDVLFIGNSKHPVTAVCSFQSGMLAFNDTRTWLLKSDTGGTIEAYSLLSDVGASSADSVICYADSPIVANSGGVYRLKSTPTLPELVTYERISAPIADKLPASALASPILFNNLLEGEIWLADPSAENGCIWVWSTEREEWYRFEGIRPSFLASGSLGTVFASENRLLAFDRTRADDSGEPYDCSYVSNYFDFDSPEKPHRALRACVTATLNGSLAEMSIFTEKRVKTRQMLGKDSGIPELFDFRVACGRHRFLRFSLSMSATPGARLHRIALFANR